MSKIEESLTQIPTIEDTTQRALAVAGLVSTLLRIKKVHPVLVGNLAYDCYVDAVATDSPIEFQMKTAYFPLRVIQEVMVEQLHGEGYRNRWSVAGISIEFQGQLISQHPEMCRDIHTEYGIVLLQSAEELTADLLVMAFCPQENGEIEALVRRITAMALAEMFEMDWKFLQTLVDSDDCRMNEKWEKIREQAEQEVDTALGKEQPEGSVEVCYADLQSKGKTLFQQTGGKPALEGKLLPPSGEMEEEAKKKTVKLKGWYESSY